MKYCQHRFVCQDIGANFGRSVSRIIRAGHNQGIGISQAFQSFEVRNTIWQFLNQIRYAVFSRDGPAGFARPVTGGVISSHKMNHQILKLLTASIAPYLLQRFKKRSERKVHRDSAGSDIDPVALPVARIEDLLLKLERIQKREITLRRSKR